MNKQNVLSLIIICILITIQFQAKAQDKTLLTIGNNKYSLEEFNYIFNKNNSLSQDPLSKEEYIPLFVNYKLKVLEAIDQGYDTLPSFKNELKYYYNELAKPYLTDKKATDAVVKEAYDHLCYDINANHILIKLPQSPSPKDTLAAYNKIAGIKTKITDLSSFEKMAKEHSDCPSSVKGGNLGYFTGFMMVYPFEKAAYDTQVGQMSDIVRTAFGYHLIYVKDKRKNLGEIKVAHIMKMYPQNAPREIKDKAKATIDTVYNALKEGADFNKMVQKYSDDRNSLSNNGELPWFSTGRMVPEFAEAAFALTENGQLSEPVQTPFGWHIIKRIDLKPTKSLEDSQEEIMQKITRDQRSYAGKKATIEKLKAEYAYFENSEELAKIKSIITSNNDAKEDILSQLMGKQTRLASFATQNISTAVFAGYLQNKRIKLNQLDEQTFNKTWQNFTDDTLLDYEKSMLEDKHPEFRFLMNEYHDGLLIFEISQKEIWNKASEDTTGLKTYFEKNKDNYRLPERFDGTLFFCKKKKDFKTIKKLIASPDFELNDSIKNDLSIIAKIEQGTFTKGQHPLLDKQAWNVRKAKNKSEYKHLITLGELKPAKERQLNEVRGQVLSDYQNQLEKDWIKHLRDKYKPSVDRSILKEE